jgi:N-acetylglucosamine-6-phosphate deacetylase
MSYFDLQVNGYGGVDFNQSDLSPDALHRACAALEQDGVTGILATVITDTIDVMCARLQRLRELRERDALAQRIIAGFHVEGPFISPVPGYRGAHPADAVVPADADLTDRLLDAGGGLVRLVTLAPECDATFHVTRLLARHGIVVSAGHTDASLDQLRGAIDAGLGMFTHVGNGCPMTLHRHDNIIQRALHLRERLWLCFIADGVHVPAFALRNYLGLAGIDRCIVVTDAIAPAGLGPGRYTLGRWDLQIGDDLVARAPDGSHFVGSAGTMRQSHANLREKLRLGESECRALLCDNARAALNVGA